MVFLCFLVCFFVFSGRLDISHIFPPMLLYGRISEHADRVLSVLSVVVEKVESRSSRVVSTSATRLARSANRRASQRRRRISGAMTCDLHSRMESGTTHNMNHCHIRRQGRRHTDTDADEDKDKDNDTDTGRPLPSRPPSVVIVRLASKLALWRWFLLWPL